MPLNESNWNDILYMRKLEAWRVCISYDLRTHSWFQIDVVLYIYVFITFLQFTVDWMLVRPVGAVPCLGPFYKFCVFLCQWLLCIASWDTGVSAFNGLWKNLNSDREWLVSFQWCFQVKRTQNGTILLWLALYPSVITLHSGSCFWFIAK